MKHMRLGLILLGTLALIGCRGSDEVGNTADPIQFPAADDPDGFAAFLNPEPGIPKFGGEIGGVNNVEDFPEAYYNTIDPDGTRDTFEKWRIANGFLNPDGSVAPCELPECVSAHAKFRDTKDLGYGRNMFLRWIPATQTVAVYVENFQVDAIDGIPYGPLNFEALVRDDRRWNFGVNAIEFSPFPYGGNKNFTKFYNFAGDGIRAVLASGMQQHFVDLDSRGLKAMPTPCIVCHGGRGRTLVYEDAQGVKKLAPTITGGMPGDVMAQMQTIEFDTLQFADAVGFRREDNEKQVQLINAAVLDTYRHRKANFTRGGEWNADFAIELVEGRYGGDPANEANQYNPNFVPAGWASGGSDSFNEIVGPHCSVCHALRGTNENPSIAFGNVTTFGNYGSRIDHLVFDRGLMPLGLLNYSQMWDGDKNVAELARAAGVPDRVEDDLSVASPGQAVAVIAAAPRVIAPSGQQQVDFSVSARSSAFTDLSTATWRVTPATGVSITSGDKEGESIVTVPGPGEYNVQLSALGRNGEMVSSSQTVQVISATSPSDVNTEVTFFGATGIASLVAGNCAGGCHQGDPTSGAPTGNGIAGIPIHYEACRDDNLNGHEFLYRSVLARVNFDSPLDSLFLRKPANGATNPLDLNGSQISSYHGGNLVLSNNQYSRILSWILDGAPPGDIPTSAVSASAPTCL